MTSTINDRIEALINKRFKGNKTAFAKELGFPPTGMSSYFGKQRRSKPSLDMIIKIIKDLNVDPRWLLLGEEPKEGIVYTKGNYSPASLNGDVNVIKDIEIKDDTEKIDLFAKNDKLIIENEMLKRLISEKDNYLAEKDRTIKEKERLIEEKERFITYLVSKNN